VHDVVSPGSRKGTKTASLFKAIKDEMKPTGTAQKNTSQNMAP